MPKRRLTDADVRAMIDGGHIDRGTALKLFNEIEPLLYRYPAIAPPTFLRKVEEILSER